MRTTEWHAAIGMVVETIVARAGNAMPLWRPGSAAARHFLAVYHPLDEWQLKALDQVAFLLTDRAVTRRRHQQELRDEQQEAQRGARDSYSAGLLEGLDQRNRG